VLSDTDYRTIVEQAPLMIWRANVGAKCDYFNERWLAFTGRSMDQETGDGWMQGVHPADLDRCLGTYLRAFGLREAFEVEYRLRRYDGEYRWVLDVGGPIHDADGRFAGFVGSCVDVTDRVQARAALARTNLKDLGISQT
jgi:PAS domain S-box-containing protein